MSILKTADEPATSLYFPAVTSAQFSVFPARKYPRIDRALRQHDHAKAIRRQPADNFLSAQILRIRVGLVGERRSEYRDHEEDLSTLPGRSSPARRCAIDTRRSSSPSKTSANASGDIGSTNCFATSGPGIASVSISGIESNSSAQLSIRPTPKRAYCGAYPA